ncbi:unnamed protein product [Nezara viridula]|uniref:Exosome complex component 10 homolog n=1 Tax=Nezara viridula TaxID=85310 RepID=A0A9P0H1C3_NEZVI|nr:unnamed protein product [Nezara viridula]
MEGESDSASSKELIPGHSSLQAFIHSALPNVLEGIKASNSLPSPQDFSYYRTYPEFVNVMKYEGMKLKSLMDCLMKRNGMRKIDHNFDTIIDSNDKSLDRVTNNLLEMDGRKRNPLPSKPSTNAQTNVPSGGWHDKDVNSQPSKEEVTLCVSSGTIRPQVFFKDKIDNSNSPWIPRIKEKPNALKPLSILVELNDLGHESYSHPYDYELTLWKPEESMLSTVKVTKPLPFSETPYLYVETEEQLNSLKEDLSKANEFAVDLEHHSYRTFMGFTCVLQISTWTKDYVIDALKLRDKLHVLNEVFTNPAILKVFHGADSDVEWLQRDLSIYVINMFDTYQASKLLGFARLSLAHLLYRYCKVEANKEYQLFDWRKRPLPESAIKYAREDTHYLLYIYQLMRNELIQHANGKTNLLEAVFDRSRDTCRKVYCKPSLEEDSHMAIYRRLKLSFDNRQLYALREIYRWRDRVARQEDESCGYVLPNHMMVQICRTLPREVQGILACCNPIPPLVRTYLLEIHQIILRAKEQPLVKSLVEEAVQSEPGVERDLRLILPQDNSGLEFRDDLPTLLGGGLSQIATSDEMPTPIISAFADIGKNNTHKSKEKLGKLKFISPYERYIKVLPYAIQLEKEERERREKEEEERLSSATNALEINAQVAQPEPESQPLAKNRGYLKKARIERGEIPAKQENKPSPAKSPRVGVVGGEVRLSAKNSEKNFKHSNSHQFEESEGYDYSKVNYNKFQSGGAISPNGKRKAFGQKFQNKRKKKNFQDRNVKKKRGGHQQM